MLRRGTLFAALALVLVGVPAAQAGTARVSLNAVEYAAAAGERNLVSFAVSGPRGSELVTVRDTAGVQPGPRCTRPSPADPTTVVCAPVLGDAVPLLEAVLGDGHDSISVTGAYGIQAAGGAGDDTLTGTPHDDRLSGGPGRDVVRGGRGDDSLSAGGGPGDRLAGGPGEDRLHGGPSADVLDGGAATDRLFGVGGDDELEARDGTPDAVFCGRGRDVARVDGVDFISSACDRRTRGRSGAATVIEPDYRFFSPSFNEGGTNLEIGCPGDGPRRCTGTVIVRRRGKVLGRGPFSIGRDRIGQARSVRPTQAGAALPTGKRVRATIILVTADRRGRRVVRRRVGSAEDFPASEFE